VRSTILGLVLGLVLGLLLGLLVEQAQRCAPTPYCNMVVYPVFVA